MNDNTSVKSVPDALRDLGNLYAERNKLYGSNYKFFGNILHGIFPDGITLNGPEEFNRFALFLQLVHKISRYARSMPKNGHEDSLDDTSVYAQLLQEYDRELSALKAKKG